MADSDPEPRPAAAAADTAVSIAVVLGLLLCLAALAAAAMRGIGMVPFDQPPAVGERAEDVIERLGEPELDSRGRRRDVAEYELGYTDGMGTRHHLLVLDGVVVEIRYSSR